MCNLVELGLFTSSEDMIFKKTFKFGTDTSVMKSDALLQVIDIGSIATQQSKSLGRFNSGNILTALS